MSSWKSAEIIAAIQSKSNEGPVKQVILLEKYFDISDIFEKTKTNKLNEPLSHYLANELKNDRQLFFESIYNFFRTELEMMREYVNKILAKKFI